MKQLNYNPSLETILMESDHSRNEKPTFAKIGSERL